MVNSSMIWMELVSVAREGSKVGTSPGPNAMRKTLGRISVSGSASGSGVAVTMICSTMVSVSPSVIRVTSTISGVGVAQAANKVLRSTRIVTAVYHFLLSILFPPN